jgi:3',5'-cyclic AMP phosphodiesterase CpdA
MKIIHFSDPHTGAFPDSISAFTDKRLVGTFNYTFKRRFLHNLEAFQKAVDYILAEKPEIAVCTGDITSTGQPAEFNTAVEILQPLINSPDIKLIYIPGNHDAYVKNRRCREALEATFSLLNEANPRLEALPLKLTISDCDFLLVNECRPTNIFLSTGYMTQKSTEQITEWCSEEKLRPKIIIGHFPLRKKYTLMEFRHKIYYQEKIIKLLNEKKIDLSLCGHTHKPFLDIDKEGRGEIGAGSITRTNDLNIIEYDKKSDFFTHRLVII